MRVLFVTSEAVPLAKTGGLADVSGALPAALSAVGCEIRLALPRYKSIDLAGWREAGTVDVMIGEREQRAAVWEGRMPDTGIPVWLIDSPHSFGRDGLYGEHGRDYPDNLTRFTLFCRAVLAWLNRQPWRPDLIHCNDWQSALIPVIVAVGGPPNVPTLLTIHNLAYQGLFPAEQFGLTGLPAAFYTPAALEFWGQVNVLKGGLVFAGALSTVSETYAQEIQTAEFGAGLDGVLRDRRGDLHGILNGVDYRIWDPASDPLIPARYGPDDLSGKQVCKAALQRELGLSTEAAAPLIGMVTRLADQKGLDLVAEVIQDVLAGGAQFVLLGTGDPAHERTFSEVARSRPRQAAARIGFDNALAHRIEAGADMFLMPSRYEPSGLNQLYSLRYGTIPVVRRTGGLADSIIALSAQALAEGTANGFVFEAYTPTALREALRRAMAAFGDQQLWRRLQHNGMRADFSWAAAARKYKALYERTLARGVQQRASG